MSKKVYKWDSPVGQEANILFAQAKKKKKMKAFYPIIENRTKRKIEKYFSHNRVIRFNNQVLCVENYDMYYDNTVQYTEAFLACILGQSLRKFVIKEYKKWMLPRSSADWDSQLVSYYNALSEKEARLFDFALLSETILVFLSKNNVLALISKNPCYKGFDDLVSEYWYRSQLMQASILERIPDNYAYLYPGARMTKRHFVLHIGPTNSGKTYESLRAFLKASKGIYLAPLRLLAYEVYETANQEGVPCRMVTGEEILEVDGATHQSSTIEMMSLSAHYDLAVIDESQMIGDEQRGGFWTEAILGICADTIHICASENAVNIIIGMINLCNDSYEIHRHSRQTTLMYDSTVFHFPRSIQEKDALIVFSKKSVLACAAAVQKSGIPCSVIYGALPYDVRRREMERFISGETKVVVATDAIGMGLNLPIKRVILLETEKFDGKEVRPLRTSEIKQIIGRAGRRGIYDVGLFTAEYQRKWVKRKMEEAIPEIEKAIVKFPERLLSVTGSLSEILQKWNSIPENGIFQKADISREISFCEELEQYTDNKQLIYRFITIPFPERNMELYYLWRDLFFVELDKATGGTEQSNTGLIDLQRTYGTLFFDIIGPRISDNMNLEELEKAYQVCDLLCHYYRITKCDELKVALKSKVRISSKIMDLLAKSELPVRKCRICSRELPWNYTYKICQRCYEREDGWYW